jgi:hypothetical protein
MIVFVIEWYQILTQVLQLASNGLMSSIEQAFINELQQLVAKDVNPQPVISGTSTIM